MMTPRAIRLFKNLPGFKEFRTDKPVEKKKRSGSPSYTPSAYRSSSSSEEDGVRFDKFAVEKSPIQLTNLEKMVVNGEEWDILSDAEERVPISETNNTPQTPTTWYQQMMEDDVVDPIISDLLSQSLLFE